MDFSDELRRGTFLPPCNPCPNPLQILLVRKYLVLSRENRLSSEVHSARLNLQL